MAILDDPETLAGAIRELYSYGMTDKSSNRPRRGIIFRVVESGERQAFVSKLEWFFGTKRLSSQESVYGFPVGQFHVVDDSFMSHFIARHSTESDPELAGVTVEDLIRIPQVVNPKWIREFAFIKKTPRVVYERAFGQTRLVVVEEIQPKIGLSVKTLYKKR